jgi:hypothetical protein
MQLLTLVRARYSSQSGNARLACSSASNERTSELISLIRSRFQLCLGRFLTSSRTPRDIHPGTKATAAHSRGPTGPNLMVMNVIVGSGTKDRKADKIKNMTALMTNERGSLRVPPGISRLLFSTA